MTNPEPAAALRVQRLPIGGNIPSGVPPRCIVSIRFNREKQLNALDVVSAQALKQELESLRQDPSVAAIVLQGAARSFCAGGDVKALYQAFITGEQDYPHQYINTAYPLVAMIAKYPKPILGVCRGVGMGMGMGLLMACRYRVLSETANLAMPETAIGIYPDGGAAWFFSRMTQPKIGLALALSGASISAWDALYMALVHAVVDDAVAEHFPSLLAQSLGSVPYGETDAAIRYFLTRYDRPATPLAAHSAIYHCVEPLRSCFPETGTVPISLTEARHTLIQIYTRLLSAQPPPLAQHWWQTMQANLRYASPLALLLSYWHCARCTAGDFDQVIASDIALSLRICAQSEEMREGVRALLIDRDRRPRWRYGSLEEVDIQWVRDRFLEPEILL